MADAAAGQIEDDASAVGSSPVWPTSWTARPARGRRERDARRRPARGDRTVGEPADGRPDDDDHRLRVPVEDGPRVGRVRRPALGR